MSISRGTDPHWKGSLVQKTIIFIFIIGILIIVKLIILLLITIIITIMRISRGRTCIRKGEKEEEQLKRNTHVPKTWTFSWTRGPLPNWPLHVLSGEGKREDEQLKRNTHVSSFAQPTPFSSNQPTTRTAVTFSPFAARQIKHIYGLFSFSQIK